MRAVDELDAPAADALEPPPRPARPGAIELAAALLIVGGALGVIGFFVAGAPEAGGLEAISLVTLGLNLAQIVVGLLLRVGRLWLIAVNYAAVLAFLDLLASGVSPTALMLAAAEILVVVILFAQRPWFLAMGAWRATDRVPTISP